MKKSNKDEVKCKQCGSCCSIWNGNEFVDCKYLIRYIPGTSSTYPSRCSIYQHRLYAIIGKNQYCGKRSHNPFNYPGCPFNKENQETHPRFIKSQVD